VVAIGIIQTPWYSLFINMGKWRIGMLPHLFVSTMYPWVTISIYIYRFAFIKMLFDLQHRNGFNFLLFWFGVVKGGD
jgi:hypothetical protein